MVLLPRLTPPLAFRRQPRLIRSSSQHSIGNVVVDSGQSVMVLVCLEPRCVRYFSGQYGHLESDGLALGKAASDAPVLLTTTVATFVLAFWTHKSLCIRVGEATRRGKGGEEGGGVVIGKVADREEV